MATLIDILPHLLTVLTWLSYRELETTAQSLKGVEEEKKDLQKLTEILHKTLEVSV